MNAKWKRHPEGHYTHPEYIGFICRKGLEWKYCTARYPDSESMGFYSQTLGESQRTAERLGYKPHVGRETP